MFKSIIMFPVIIKQLVEGDNNQYLTPFKVAPGNFEFSK